LYINPLEYFITNDTYCPTIEYEITLIPGGETADADQSAIDLINFDIIGSRFFY